MGCLSCCGKCILIFTNVGFLLFGLLFLAAGILVKVGLENYLGDYAKGIIDSFDELSSATVTLGVSPIDILNNMAIAFIVIGCIVIIIAILGMCGACCDNKCMLATYAAIVLLILIVHVALVIAFATGQFTSLIEKEVKKIITEDYGGDEDYTLQSVIINAVQLQLQCCGWGGSTDYDGAIKWSRRSNTSTTSDTIIIPYSCCKVESYEACRTAPTSTNSNKDTGCFEKVSEYITAEYMTYAIIAVCVILFDEFLLVVIAIYLTVRIGKKKKRGGHYDGDIEVTVRAGTGRKPRY